MKKKILNKFIFQMKIRKGLYDLPLDYLEILEQEIQRFRKQLKKRV